MRTGRWIIGLLPGVLFTVGCSSMSQTEAGAVGGGLLGAGAGALIGSATGHTGAGAAIGAGVGALAGGVTGNAVEESEKRTKAEIQAAAAAQAQARPPLGLVDVVTMSQQHISDSVIITQIRNSGCAYNLGADHLVYAAAGFILGQNMTIEQIANVAEGRILRTLRQLCPF